METPLQKFKIKPKRRNRGGVLRRGRGWGTSREANDEVRDIGRSLVYVNLDSRLQQHKRQAEMRRSKKEEEEEE